MTKIKTPVLIVKFGQALVVGQRAVWPSSMILLKLDAEAEYTLQVTGRQ